MNQLEQQLEDIEQAIKMCGYTMSHDSDMSLLFSIIEMQHSLLTNIIKELKKHEPTNHKT